MNQAGLFLPVPVFGQNRAKMAYFQTQGRGGQTHSNLKINIFFWFPTENYNRNHPLIRELVLVPPLSQREMKQINKLTNNLTNKQSNKQTNEQTNKQMNKKQAN